ncbi:uncharacterized protein BJ171DRAFT_579290 [Polychytrium aggregatum]|uniref:uncharacterized protein n=1 Tax=Polychytrium aggregatum TaxID=110093 RepID=UPI0022FEAFB9|nr:uncharacterized protein BJ171DRAFT_579290 [Polychytrium aggregatum]KAI9206933.1 hypothetical protein BJ171DRAFT_579290 [Polychytrium aggregatum]
MPPPQRPLSKLAKGAAACSQSALKYGKCMDKVFGDVVQGSCAAEFEEFKACLRKALRKP